MRLMQHEHVLPYYSAFVADRELWVVLPLMEQGRLNFPYIFEVMDSRKKGLNMTYFEKLQNITPCCN